MDIKITIQHHDAYLVVTIDGDIRDTDWSTEVPKIGGERLRSQREEWEFPLKKDGQVRDLLRRVIGFQFVPDPTDDQGLNLRILSITPHASKFITWWIPELGEVHDPSGSVLGNVFKEDSGWKAIDIRDEAIAPESAPGARAPSAAEAAACLLAKAGVKKP